ncbi:MAG: hypothetical protein U9P90_01455 [Patescibacteria group bacterium]|nr:hypothetical protein [Patescibacteria group bacterium]
MEDKNTNTNYQVPHGFSSDEDDVDENTNGFTNIETPGESPDEENETPTDENDGISFELETEDEESSFAESSEDKKEDEESIEAEEETVEELAEIPPQPIEESVEASLVGVQGQGEVQPLQDVSAGQANVIKKILDRITEEIDQIKKLLPGEAEAVGELTTSPDANVAEDADGSVVEGVFDGEGMVGSDGKRYDVPANYASKSKLVEGDILKLTVNPDGSFLFKQIGPSERNRVVGTLAYDPTQGRYLVTSEDKKWYILTASVTYFKGKPGDETVILVPKSAPSRWAAVENIISKREMGEKLITTNYD